MKIFSIINNFHSEGMTDWMLLPDSAIIRGGKPIFLPDEEEEMVMMPSLCLRIGRLGKHIAPKFAHRYFDGMAAAVQFMPVSAANQIARGVAPPASAIAFDNALVVGEFTEIDTTPTDVSLLLEITDSDLNLGWNLSSLCHSPDEVLAMVSRFNSMKMGDLIILGLTPEGLPAQRETSVRLTFPKGKGLNFKIK